MASLRDACRLACVLVLVAASQLAGAPAWAAAKQAPLLNASVLNAAGLFEEPLMPTASAPSDDDAALAQAITAYRARTRPDDTRALEDFLAAHPQSRWRLALLTNLGLTYYRYGYFAKAIDAFQNAWDAGRDATDLHARALADRALGELLQMHARLGHADRLAALLAETADRGLIGAAYEMRDNAKQGLWAMRNRPGIAYLCGPMALKNLLLAQGAKPEAVAFLDDYRSGPHGVTLAEVGRLADQAGLAHVLVHRTPDQTVPVPSMIHWKVNHFAAIIGKHNGRYRVVDPTFGSTLWVTRGAIDVEGSGDFLVPGATPPAGLRPISTAQASDLYGMGYTHSSSPGALTSGDASSQSNTTNCGGLCGYSFKEMLVSLALADTPVGYTPPIGPAVRTTITYNQREMGQPANFSFYNVSPQWTLNWQSYVVDDPTMPGNDVVRHAGGGGEIDETDYEPTRGTFAPEPYDASVLRLKGAASYVRSLPDGSVEEYSVSDGATTQPRLIFLSKVVDPQGNAITLRYDAQLRLTTITDATGLVTRFGYENAAFPLQITRITDPFGRAARLDYDSIGRLGRITDVLGLQSVFDYDVRQPSLVKMLTTPYGTTHFVAGDDGNTRFLSATDPLGHTESLMFQQRVAGIRSSEPARLVPQGIIDPYNQFLQDRDTFYWDKHAYAVGAGDVTQARIRHWAHLRSSPTLTSDFLESEKQPLENRVWFNYPGQPTTGRGAGASGTLNKPSRIGRVLDGGATQLTVIGYNDTGNPTGTTDPVGRTTMINYHPNGIDVANVQQVAASGPVAIASYTYDGAHRPLTYTDAAGRTTHYRYTGAEQLKEVIDALGERTQFSYYPDHRLAQIVNADGKVALSLTYDRFGRVATSTDSEGYVLQYGYDNFDRVTKVTYPDDTTRGFKYRTLDLVSFTDRQGRQTRYQYDAVRDLTDVIDPLGHRTHFTPYENGVLKTLVDPDGNPTMFGIDVQSRVTAKQYADGSTWTYGYEPTTSRLQSVTDPLGQVKTYGYTTDDRVASLGYANTINPTPDVAFAYDPYFPRRMAMTDGSGKTTYHYNVPGRLGALQLASESPPFAHSAIAYGYDPLGRLAARSVGGDAESFGYDAIGRLSGHADDLGTFKLAYLGETGQLTGRSNGVVATAWSYDTNLHDRKLIAVANKPAASAYQFPNNAPEGDIQSIVDSFNGQTWTLGYDQADRLRTATSTSGTADGYTLDPAGNLDAIARPNGSLAIPPNALNQAIRANHAAFSYDADGNLVADASRKYAWDAEGRLVGIGYRKDASVVTTMRYDGLGRRIAIGTMQGGSTVETHYGWCGSVLCQSRTGADAPLRRYLAEGEVTPGENAYDYYSVDQLGSVRDALDASTGASAAHYDYEWYGVPLGMPKASATDFRYAGLFLEQRSGLYLSATRAYDPVVGRWLSRDPIGEAGGVNLYGYVGGEPTRYFDPSGLWGLGVTGGATAEGGIGVAGAGGTGSVGTGVFGKGLGGINTGSFASGGAFAGGPGYGVGFPGAQPGGASAAVGGYAGIGRGFFITNATNAGQLSGPFNTYSFNLGLGLGFSIQFGISNGIGIFSITAGPGGGFSLTTYPTTTAVIGSCGH